MKRHRKPGISAAVRRFVLDRDGMCLLAVIRRDHTCRDRWGEPHIPEAVDRLTIEHVREEAGGARRDDPAWLVAMCHSGNTNHEGSTTEDRARINAYLCGVRAMERMLR